MLRRFALIALTLFVSLAFSESSQADPLRLASSTRDALAVYQNGSFNILSENSFASSSSCGTAGDLPVPGNYLSGLDARIAVWNPSFGQWRICGDDFELRRNWGMPGDIPVPGDRNGDGLTDYTVFRPGTNQWFTIVNSGSIESGSVEVQDFDGIGGIPVSADFDGDGKADFGVVSGNTSSGGLEWTIKGTAGSEQSFSFGLASDVPVPADYDSTGSAQAAVWRASSGTWFIRSADGSVRSLSFGIAGDIPSPADVDGDGKIDLVVYRPEAGKWLVSSDGGVSVSGEAVQGSLGVRIANDSRAAVVERTAALDLNGDRFTDLAVLRSGENGVLQFFLQTGRESTHSTPVLSFGVQGDSVVFGDYDGDGVSDAAVARTADGFVTWYIKRSSRQAAGEEVLAVTYGLAGDSTLPADYDGDGKTDLGVVRSLPDGTRLWVPNASGAEAIAPVIWGLIGDVLRSADMDGDGRSDFVAIRQINGELVWFVQLATGEIQAPKNFGFTGDEILLGDFDGDGIAEPAVVRTTAGFKLIIVEGMEPFVWGLEGDQTLAGAYAGTSALQVASWRLINGQGFFFVRGGFRSAAGIPLGVTGDTPVPSTHVIVAGEATNSTSSGTNSAGTSSDGGTRLNCASRTSASNQSPGFVWKPISEGDGNLVVLFSAARAGSVLRAALVESGPDSDVVLETLRFVGNTNGGRPTFRANRAGRGYPNNIILVRQSQDSTVHCIDVPSPGQRYD